MMKSDSTIKENKSTERLSKELQIGKAAEHLVCAELILRGYIAFLADAGNPYDVIVDVGSKLIRVQVKSTTKEFHRPNSDPREQASVYRFGMRKGNWRQGKNCRFLKEDVDVFAFVALDIRKIAFLHVEELINNGNVVTIVEFTDESSGIRWGKRTFQKCSDFLFSSRETFDYKRCFRCGEYKPSNPENFVPNKNCNLGLSGWCRICSRLYDNSLKKRQREEVKETKNASQSSS